MPRGTKGAGPLSGVRVVEWGGGVSAPYATRLLAELGADVIKVESPVGDPARREPTLFSSLNAGKNSVVVDEQSPDAAARLTELVTSADIWVTNRSRPDRKRFDLTQESLRAAAPHLVVVTVTPYGDSGPYRDVPGTGLTVSALGGATWVIGSPGRPPLALPFDLADYQGGVQAAAAALAAYFARVRIGEGRWIDVASADVIATYTVINSSFYVGFGHPWKRAGSSASASGGAYPYSIFRCRDGYVAMIGRTERDWRALVSAMGDPAWTRDPRFASAKEIARHHQREVDSHVIPWLMTRTREQLADVARDHGLAIASVQTMSDVLTDPQFAERAVFPVAYRFGAREVSPPVSPLHRMAGAPGLTPPPRTPGAAP